MFYTVLYSLIGTLFFSYYHSNSFWLSINGNGGFVGNFLGNTFLTSLINLNKEVFYFILIIFILILFLISINFKLSSFLSSIKLLFRFVYRKKEIHRDNNEQNVDQYIEAANEDKNIFQKDLPFIKNTNEYKTNKSKFILPPIDLLKSPTKKEREKSSNENGIDPSFLEKILLDFGVEGKIKKVSHGPVVTLNEFEPAAGIKVSKIINLSEDIARNTSSESARISTIPGRSPAHSS